jgi:hypothetical protein
MPDLVAELLVEQLACPENVGFHGPYGEIQHRGNLFIRTFILMA